MQTDHDESRKAHLMRCRREVKRMYPAVEPILFAPLPGDRLSEPAVESSEDREQREFLAVHSDCQERKEAAFCKGMLVGGAIALTVLAVTLKVVGVL